MIMTYMIMAAINSRIRKGIQNEWLEVQHWLLFPI